MEQPSFLQLSRSSASGIFHAPPAAEATAQYPKLQRSKSAARNRTSSTVAAAETTAATRRKPKENLESPSPRQSLLPPPSPELGISTRRTKTAAVVPSAWALSPGRSPAVEVEVKRRSGVLGLFRRKKDASPREEEAHQLKMMTTRLLQWRFANARAAAAMTAAQYNAEKKLFNGWLRLYELRNIVAAKDVIIQSRRQKLKVLRILKPQIQLLNHWEPLAKRNLEAVTGLGRVLGSICLSLPFVEGAKGNIGLIHRFITSAADIMAKIEANLKVFYYKVEEMSSVLNELLSTVRLEMEELNELTKTSRNITFLEQMHEISLRTSIIQALNELKATANLHLQMQSLTY